MYKNLKKAELVELLEERDRELADLKMGQKMVAEVKLKKPKNEVSKVAYIAEVFLNGHSIVKKVNTFYNAKNGKVNASLNYAVLHTALEERIRKAVSEAVKK